MNVIAAVLLLAALASAPCTVNLESRHVYAPHPHVRSIPQWAKACKKARNMTQCKRHLWKTAWSPVCASKDNEEACMATGRPQVDPCLWTDSGTGHAR